MIREDAVLRVMSKTSPNSGQTEDFNLTRTLTYVLATSSRRDACVLMHNNAVIQALTELTFLSEVERWRIMTIVGLRDYLR